MTIVIVMDDMTRFNYAGNIHTTTSPNALTTNS